jgi:hypothetical protein
MTTWEQTPKHVCLQRAAHDRVTGYGCAIWDISYDAERGFWEAGNGEYGSEILYCPWCGIKLELNSAVTADNPASLHKTFHDRLVILEGLMTIVRGALMREKILRDPSPAALQAAARDALLRKRTETDEANRRAPNKGLI